MQIQRDGQSLSFLSKKLYFVFGISIVSLLIIIGGIVPGCGRAADENEILIGEYSSLTGTAATFGTSTHNALALAVEEINDAGGVLGKKIKVLTEDDQSKPEEAATAVTKLITRDKVKAIIGENASSRSLAAAPICQANSIPMVSPSSTNPKVTQVGDYIFRICFIDPFQGTVCANFAYNSLNVKHAAILKDVKNEYSIGLAEFFATKFKESGGTIVAEQAYSEGDNDFKAQLTALKASSPELIFVPGYYTESALIVKQARELNITIPFLGGDGWDSGKLIEIGGSAMENTYFCTHYSAMDTNAVVQHFVTKYRSKYNETPDVNAVLGYDVGKLLADAIQRAGTMDGSKLRDAIAATKNFHGVTGSITINGERNATKPAVILAIRNGKLTYRETVQP
ncbi:MAG: ABC transporter substrate-binding protein [Ignavibacteria bacterium]|nr:ABC transporter substrate-binding protein [Ignavibacteria bacterium]